MATNLQLQPSLEGNLSAPEASEYLPITSIISNDDIGHTEITKEKLIFCYRVVQRTIEAYQKGEFTQFDALTTTTCCHGMSVLVGDIITQLKSTDLNVQLSKLTSIGAFLENDRHLKQVFLFAQNFVIPKSLITLSQLFILSFTKEKDIYKNGWKTVTNRLSRLYAMGSRFFDRLVKVLQIYFSNLIAESYLKILKQLPSSLSPHGVPINLWGQYIQNEHIRIDRRGRKYAPCLFSMQIVLSHLINRHSIIGFMADVRCEQGDHLYSHIQLLKGDGFSEFYPIDFKDLQQKNNSEPIIVFSGCRYSKCTTDRTSWQAEITTWLSRFSSLILASDTHYPQFPRVRDDSNFDSTPIIPGNKQLRKVIQVHKQVEGVSASDPSLYCLSHIYTASLQQIKKAYDGCKSSLPKSFLSTKLRNLPQSSLI